MAQFSPRCLVRGARRSAAAGDSRSPGCPFGLKIILGLALVSPFPALRARREAHETSLPAAKPRSGPGKHGIRAPWQGSVLCPRVERCVATRAAPDLRAEPLLVCARAFFYPHGERCRRDEARRGAPPRDASMPRPDALTSFISRLLFTRALRPTHRPPPRQLARPRRLRMARTRTLRVAIARDEARRRSRSRPAPAAAASA